MCGFLESPNKDKSRGGYKPEAIVIHICDGTFEGTKEWFLNPASKVSAHFLISEKGEVLQMVDCADTAWHAGGVKNPTWRLLKPNVNPNKYTIGIELAGFAKNSPPAFQILMAGRLAAKLCREYNIKIDGEHIIPHRWITSAKTCPGFFINVDVIIYLAILSFNER